jgi:hypothetical protein
MRNRTTLHFVVAGLACLSPVAGVRPARAEEGWSAERVVKLLQAREQAVPSLEVLVSRRYEEGPDWKSYSLTSVEKEEAMDRFYGTKPAKPRRPPHETHTQPPAPEFYWLRKNRLGDLRVDMLSKPEPAGKNLEWSVCFNGMVWEQHLPHRTNGPSVVLDNAMLVPPVLQVVGLGTPCCSKSGSAFPYATGRLESLHDLLGAAAAAGMPEGPRAVAGPGGAKRLEFVVYRKYEDQLARLGYHRQLRLELDLSRGLAPARAEATQVQKEGGRWKEVLMPQGYTLAWGDFTEAAPGCWLARSLKVCGVAGLEMPKDGKNYRPLIKDGKRVKAPGGDPMIDFAETTMRRFVTEVTTLTATRLKVNHLGPEPLCGQEYQPGTIVENRPKGEVYQLEGVSPAVDARLRKVLQDPTKPPAGKKLRATVSAGARKSAVIVALANLALFTAIVAAYLWVRRRPAREGPPAPKA